MAAVTDRRYIEDAIGGWRFVSELKSSKQTSFLGGIWPVVQRELREGARRPVNHWLRVGSAAAGTLMLCAIVANARTPAALLGGRLFASLHSLLLALICLIVPALAADSIAREKREGTLGLLFLTPLTAGGIVAGKGLALALRIFTLWLAVVPVLTIPFLTGGVGWFDAFTAIDLEFCAAVLCLAAGLLASSLTKERIVAFTLALVFGVFFVLLFACFFFAWLFLQFRGPAFVIQFRWQPWVGEATRLFTGIWGNQSAGWSNMLAAGIRRIWIGVLLEVPPLSLLFLYFITRFAGRRIASSWQDTVPSLRRQKWTRRIRAPLFRNWFSRRMRRAVDRNPIAWLQQYSWQARVSKWGLCLAFVVVECFGLRDEFGDFQILQSFLFFVLAGCCTFAGVNGFMAEKRSGALELLLTTPISVNSIIFGRSWGLWKQFLPSALVILCFEFSRVRYEAMVYSPSDPWNETNVWLRHFAESDMQNEIQMAGALFALPFCATYFALRVKNLFAAAFLSWVALAVPIMFSEMDFGLPAGVFHFGLWTAVILWFLLLLFTNFGLVLLVCFLLRHSLSRRIYSF